MLHRLDTLEAFGGCWPSQVFEQWVGRRNWYLEGGLVGLYNPVKTSYRSGSTGLKALLLHFNIEGHVAPEQH